MWTNAGAVLRTYLTRRNGTYYVRFRIPRQLAAVVGRSEIVRSLRTRDRLTALEFLPHIEIGIRSLISDARTMSDRNRQQDIGAEDVNLEARLRDLERQLHGATTRLESFRPGQHGYTDDALDSQITEKIETVEAAVANARHAVGSAGSQADGAQIGQQAAEIEQLTSMVSGLREHLDTLYAALNQAAAGGDPGLIGTVAGRVEQAPQPSAGVTTEHDHATSGDTRLSAVREAYKTRFSDKVGAKTLRSQIDSMRDFEAFLGNVPINTVTRQNALDYRADLEQRRSDRGAKGRLSHATVQKYLSHLRGLFRFACDEEFCARNVFADVNATRPSRTIKEATKRSPFTPEELQRFLDAPLFTGYKSPGRPHDAGDQVPNRDSRFWFPLVMLWGGLRNDEITQLRFDSLVKHHGVTCFDIGESVKTPAGWRLVPVHSQLRELGFLDWVHWREQTANDVYMFDQFAYSQFFNDRLLPRIGLKRPDTVLYSLRHNFSDEMKGLDEEARDIVMGHTHRHVRSRYGSARITWRQMQVVEGVTYKGVDFSKLPVFRLEGDPDK